MIKFVYLDGDDCVIGTGQSRVAPANAVEVEANLSRADLLKMMMVEGELTARPAPLTVTSISTVHTVEGCPIGTRIDLFDCLGQEVMISFTTDVDGVDEEINLPDVGNYRIDVTPPPPQLRSIVEVKTP